MKHKIAHFVNRRHTTTQPQTQINIFSYEQKKAQLADKIKIKEIINQLNHPGCVLNQMSVLKHFII